MTTLACLLLGAAIVGLYHLLPLIHRVGTSGGAYARRFCAAITKFACILGEDPKLLADLRHGVS